MKTKILALSGRGGAWKSASIKLAYEQLCSGPDVSVEWYKSIGRHLYFLAVAKVANQKIGFSNRGDLRHWLEENLNILQAEPCSIIVCTVRQRGETQKLLSEMTTTCSVDFLQEQACGELERSRLNRAMAHYINTRIRTELQN